MPNSYLFPYLQFSYSIYWGESPREWKSPTQLINGKMLSMFLMTFKYFINVLSPNSVHHNGNIIETYIIETYKTIVTIYQRIYLVNPQAICVYKTNLLSPIYYIFKQTNKNFTQTVLHEKPLLIDVTKHISYF